MPRKHYPPWFAAIRQKNEEAKRNGTSYGKYVAACWEQLGRPRRQVSVADEPIETLSAYQVAHNVGTHEDEREEKREQNEKLYQAQQSAIRTVRRELGVSQIELGNRVGVSAYAVRSWEKGWFKAPWDKLVAAMPELAAYVPTTELEEN